MKFSGVHFCQVEWYQATGWATGTGIRLRYTVIGPPDTGMRSPDTDIRLADISRVFMQLNGKSVSNSRGNLLRYFVRQRNL